MSGFSSGSRIPVAQVKKVEGSRYAGLESKDRNLIDENIKTAFNRGRKFGNDEEYVEVVNNMRQILSNPSVLKGLQRSATSPERNPINHHACR
jgi:hypothetical protein